MVGDRVLVKPVNERLATKGGLYLPPGYSEKEEVQWGYVIKAGPGFPIPSPVDNDQPWKKTQDEIHYVPLQAKEGDLAIFLRKGAIEVIFEEEKYYIVSQHAILMLQRDEEQADL